MSFRRCASLVLALSASACASSADTSSGVGGQTAAAARGTSTLIVRAELDELTGRSLWEAVETLRGRWLRPQRGTSLAAGPSFARIVVDGTVRGELAELHRLVAENAETLRYLSAPAATIRYGTGYPGGVIEVSTRVGGG